MILRTCTVALTLAGLAVVPAACGSTSGARTEPPAVGASGPAQADAAASFAKEGFVVLVEDGRLWVQRPDQEKSEKHVTWVGAGPSGTTLKAPDADTALAYLASRPGFDVEVEEGRIWVLRPGQEKSEKSVTRVGAGPRGATVKAVDAETLHAYLAAGA